MAFGRCRAPRRLALSAPDPGRGLHLGHRRLRAGRHRAGRRHADRRAGGDERLSRRAAGPRAGRQRPRHGRQPGPTGIADFDAAGRPARGCCRAWSASMPYVEGQVDGQRQRRRLAVRSVRGVRPADLAASARSSPSNVVSTARSTALDAPRHGRDRQPDGRSGWACALGSQLTLISPKGAATAFGSVPRIKTFTVGGDLRGRDVRVRQQLRLHPARPTRRPTSSCRTG